VARRVGRLAEQAAVVLARGVDVVGLQEVTPRSWPLWRAALEAGGFAGAVYAAPTEGRSLGVVLAAREGLSRPAPVTGVPRAESALSARVGGVGVRVTVAHVPNSANGWVKVETMRALAAAARRARGGYVLMGDLNTPRRETPDGELVTFARDRYARLRPERGEEWDAAEAAPWRASGLVDCFRAVHGWEVRELSWAYPRWPRSGYRLDHVLASPSLRPVSAVYHHEWRRAGLSDHSALEVSVERT
jgi:exonuclease III